MSALEDEMSNEPIELTAADAAPSQPSGNRIKIRALTIIAVVAEVSVIAAGAVAWSVENTELVATIIASQLGIVASIVGFLTGASQPDRVPE